MQPRDKFFTALLGIRAAAGAAATEAVELVTAPARLDARGVDSLRSAMTACAQRGSWRYVVDLTRVKTMDSPGLAMLVGVLRAVRDLGGFVALVTDSMQFQRILELCARNRACKIYARTGDALAALHGATRPKTAA